MGLWTEGETRENGQEGQERRERERERGGERSGPERRIKGGI